MTTQFIHSNDGLRIAYEVQGSGRPLLLLHGLSTNRSIWSTYGWIERLRAEFKIIAIDFRGCGESDAPTIASAYTLAHYLDDLYQVADACDLDHFFLWGWSFGGTIGLQIAAQSDRLLGAVIAGSYFGRIFTEEYIQSRLSQLEPVEYAKKHGTLDQFNLSVNEQAFVERTDLTIYRARLQGLEMWPDVSPSQVRCPMLIYSGTADGNVVTQLHRQRMSIEAAGLRLHIFNNLTHMQLLSEAAMIAPIVRQMLAEC